MDFLRLKGAYFQPGLVTPRDLSKAIMREKQRLAEEKKATLTLKVFWSEFHVSINIPVIYTVTSTATDIMIQNMQRGKAAEALRKGSFRGSVRQKSFIHQGFRDTHPKKY